jgi:hypothetical protein
MKLGRAQLEEAFGALGRMARAEGRTIDIAVYGGSALILMANFRQSTADVDAVALKSEQASIDRMAQEIARERGWAVDWLNDGVRTYLTPTIEGVEQQHSLFRSYPSEEAPGLRVFVPTAHYMLAMKLHALRVDLDQAKDRDDLKNLLAVCNIATPEGAMAFAAKFYPEYEVGTRVYPRHFARLSAFFAAGISTTIEPTYGATLDQSKMDG